jgi:hypothetical protein
MKPSDSLRSLIYLEPAGSLILNFFQMLRIDGSLKNQWTIQHSFQLLASHCVTYRIYILGDKGLCQVLHSSSIHLVCLLRTWPRPYLTSGPIIKIWFNISL